MCPRDNGAMSRNAMTSGVESTGYALPAEDEKIAGSGEGEMTDEMAQNGQAIIISGCKT